MKQIIYTKKGNIEFEPTREFFNNNKRINRENAKENILILRNVLISTQVKWGLIFGTLLSAVRDNNFIEWDNDTDIFVLEEDKQDFMELIHIFKKKGFRVIKFNEKKKILSVERKNEWIDFHFFKKSFFGRRCDKYFIPKKYFTDLSEIKFFDQNFPTLNHVKDYLEFQYGKTWNIKIKDAYAEGNIFSSEEFVRKKLPLFYKIYLLFKK